MKIRVGIIACLVSFAIILAVPFALAQADKLVGVWKVTEVNIPSLASSYSTRHQTDLQPCIYIFTKKYFSVVCVPGEDARPDLPQNPTIDQLRETWDLFYAESGIYEVKESTVTFHPFVTKDPKAMKSGESHHEDFRFEGDALFFTVRPPYAPIFIESKLKRLE